MTIVISGKNIEVGESLREFVTQELRTLVEHYMGDIMEAQVVLSKENHLFNSDVTVHIGHHLVVHCHGQDEDPYRSVTNALHKLQSRIKRYKNRLQNRKRHPREEFVETSPALQYVVNGTAEDTGADAPLIIAEMNSQILALSVGEAVMRMDLSESSVLLFRNAANDQLNVVYKRPDGNVGWIDPSLKAK